MAAGRQLGCDGDLDEAAEALLVGNVARHSPPPGAFGGVARLPEGLDAGALKRLLVGGVVPLRREARPFVPDSFVNGDVLLQALEIGGSRGHVEVSEVPQITTKEIVKIVGLLPEEFVMDAMGKTEQFLQAECEEADKEAIDTCVGVASVKKDQSVQAK